MSNFEVALAKFISIRVRVWVFHNIWTKRYSKKFVIFLLCTTAWSDKDRALSLNFQYAID